VIESCIGGRMKYLYGDSTSFPLVENFLVTLCAATEACVGILRANELVEEGGRQVREAEARMNQELTQLSTLARRLEQMFGDGLSEAGKSSSSPTDLVMSRIAEFASMTLKQARADVLGWRDAAVISSASSAPHAMVLPALGAFLVKHQLPDTSWSLQWRAGLNGAPSVAEVYSRTPLGLEGTFEVVVPETQVWARPVRVAQLEKEASIQLTRKRWLRDTGPAQERLDRLFITSVVHTPERASMTLARSGKEPSPGIEIVVRNGNETSEVTVTPIERDGTSLGPPETLTGEDVVTVHRIWAHIEATISELVIYRSRMTGAKLGGTAVGEIAQPEAVAEAIIDAIAPIVREIAARSSNDAELALKRQISDGRREELFIPYDAVLSLMAGLSERNLALFDAFGIRPQSKATVRKLPPPVPRVAHLKVANG
jgi:hypothetical protein